MLYSNTVPLSYDLNFWLNKQTERVTIIIASVSLEEYYNKLPI